MPSGGRLARPAINRLLIRLHTFVYELIQMFCYSNIGILKDLEHVKMTFLESRYIGLNPEFIPRFSKKFE